jgi:hypothetical protein
MTWISVKDRLPDWSYCGEKEAITPTVLIYTEMFGVQMGWFFKQRNIDSDTWSIAHWRAQEGELEPGEEVTHWMPLPAGPQ